MSNNLLDILTAYKAGITIADQVWADPNLSAQGKQEAYKQAKAKADQLLQEPLNAAAEAHSKALAEYEVARKWDAGHLEEDPAEISLAWETLNPLVESGMSLEQVAYYATTPAQLAALARFGPARLTVEAIRANGNSPVSRDRAGELTEQLNNAILEAAIRLGVADDKTTEALTEVHQQQALKDMYTGLIDDPVNIPMNVKAQIGRISQEALDTLLEITNP